MIDQQQLFRELGLEPVNSGVYAGGWVDEPSGEEIVSLSPIDERPLARIRLAGEADTDQVVTCALEAFTRWCETPAPKRGEIVREIGLALRAKREALGRLVALEVGKVLAEGIGEVQEMIDVCDFAVGLSRQLYGLTMSSERPQHRMYEQWLPLGPIGVITAFNFPVAVWSWNAAIAAVCGDSVIWKPSPKAPLCAIAVQRIVDDVLQRHAAPSVFNLLLGPVDPVGQRLVDDHRIPLVSATGSTRMGRQVGQRVAARLGRCLLELGGNNAVIMTEDADQRLALRAVLFGAVGTAGQRCTSTRRLLLQRSIAEPFTKQLVAAYRDIRVGHPLDPDTVMGPLIDRDAVQQFEQAIVRIRGEGGEILYGGGRVTDAPSSLYVEPTIVRASKEMPIVAEETFAPILYLLEAESLEQLIALHNAVPQGLSSALFTRDLCQAERFLSPRGSDCGIANVNLGTSGAEIGGAFGGEKETGGGRESGSDAWRAYMRRQTVTINYGSDLPLAQGIRFGE
jgi:aldehyde dehydrogenase (NAD+)